MKIRTAVLMVLCLSSYLGCGQPKTILPTGELTEEQKAAIKADDARVADEESQGSIHKKKGGKK